MADNEIKNADELSVNKPRKTAATAKKKTTPSAKKSATAKKSIVKKDDVTVTDNLKIDYEITFGHRYCSLHRRLIHLPAPEDWQMLSAHCQKILRYMTNSTSESLFRYMVRYLRLIGQ